jgi:hypothetical protein
MKSQTRENTLDSLFTDIAFRLHTIEATINNSNNLLQGVYYDVRYESFWRFEITLKPGELEMISGRHDTPEFRNFIHMRGSHIRISDDKYRDVYKTVEFKNTVAIKSRAISIESVLDENI